MSASSASGAAPPYRPLCLPEASVRTSIVTLAMPRSATVCVGTPGRTLPMSPMIMTSAAKSSGCCSGYPSSAPPPTSSWPSMTSLTPTGGRPSQARRAPTWARMFDLVSAAPRPYMAPSRTTASKGGVRHSLSSPGPTTS